MEIISYCDIKEGEIYLFYSNNGWKTMICGRFKNLGDSSQAFPIEVDMIFYYGGSPQYWEDAYKLEDHVPNELSLNHIIFKLTTLEVINILIGEL